MAVTELYLPIPEGYHTKEAEITADMFPWYFSPDNPLPDPEDIDDVSLFPLARNSKQLLDYSQAKNMQRKAQGLPSIEIGTSFSMDLITRKVIAEPLITGVHGKVQSLLSANAMFTLHDHNTDEGEILQRMSSHRDHFPGVIERRGGRLSRANLVVTQQYGEPPTFYLSLATTDTPSMSLEQREAYDIKWETIRLTAGQDERKALEARLEKAYGKVYARWQTGMENGLTVVNLYKEKEKRGILTPEERVIWQSEASRLQELNRQAEIFAQDPDVLEATIHLQDHIAQTDHAVRIAAAKDIGVTMLMATGWDMQFRKMDAAA